jgi:hypothetical protein
LSTSVTLLYFSNQITSIPSTLAGTDGQPLVELDKAMFFINLGQLTMERELIVADIEDDALLGLDILMKGPGHPFQYCC